jgi:small subunit ribosomal protein S1
MAHGYVRTPSDVVNEGQEVEAQVLDVNRRKKQIKLSLKALQEEPVKEEEPAHMIETAQKDRSTRRRRPRGEGRESGGGDYHAILAEQQQQSEPDPTAMEIAMREAMEKAKARSKADKGKRSKANVSHEQEEILSRTLENKVKTN